MNPKKKHTFPFLGTPHTYWEWEKTAPGTLTVYLPENIMFSTSYALLRLQETASPASIAKDFTELRLGLDLTKVTSLADKVMIMNLWISIAPRDVNPAVLEEVEKWLELKDKYPTWLFRLRECHHLYLKKEEL